MTRKLCMLLASAVVVAGAFLAPAASAQGSRTCVFTVAEEAPPIEVPPATSVPVQESDTDQAASDNASARLVDVDVDSADATAEDVCADAQAYPGPFTNMPVTPSGPYSVPIGLTPSAPVAAPEQAESPTAGLAHSGSEVFVLAYLGTGLLAFGAVALGIRRGSRVH